MLVQIEMPSFCTVARSGLYAWARFFEPKPSHHPREFMDEDRDVQHPNVAKGAPLVAPDVPTAQGEQPQPQGELEVTVRLCILFCFIFCGCPTKGLFYTSFVEYA